MMHCDLISSHDLLLAATAVHAAIARASLLSASLTPCDAVNEREVGRAQKQSFSSGRRMDPFSHLLMF